MSKIHAAGSALSSMYSFGSVFCQVDAGRVGNELVPLRYFLLYILIMSAPTVLSRCRSRLMHSLRGVLKSWILSVAP